MAGVKRRLRWSGPDPNKCTLQALEAGAELTGASVVYRHEDESLLVRLPVAKLPGVQTAAQKGSALACVFTLGCTPGVAGSPGVVYGLAFEAGGVRYEVRVLRAAAAAAPPGAPFAALYRCELACTETARLAGVVGTTGKEALAAIPLSAFGGKPGDPITGLRAYTGVGEAAAGAPSRADEAALPNTRIPQPLVEIGVSAGQDISVEATVTPTGAAFSGSISQQPADGWVWTRACLGETCGGWRSDSIG